MADVAVQYVLATPGGTLTFNDGAEDEYYLTDVQGIDAAPLRNPTDDAPQMDGAIVHDRFDSGMRPVLAGILMIRSTRIQVDVQTIRNQMELFLIEALRSIKIADGTLSWTPLGGSAQSLTVRIDVPLDIQYIDNYLNKQFTFGLISASSIPS